MTSNNPNYYQNQKLRGLKRKYEAIMAKGGKCEICGYDKNLAALDFHHVNPEEKEFQIDARKFANSNLNTLKEELDKCILVCANCHRELHYPLLTFDKVLEKINDCIKVSFSDNKQYVQVCPICGKEFKKTTNHIYCSEECREQARIQKIENKNYPSFEEITKRYDELNSWDKVAKSFGLTRKIIKGIRERNNGVTKYRNVNDNICWVVNKETQTAIKIQKSELETYLTNGYIRGRKTQSMKKYIINDLISKDELKELLKTKTQKEISKNLNIGLSTLKRYLKENNL